MKNTSNLSSRRLNRFCFLSNAIEESVYLLNVVCIYQTRSDVELFITSAPAWPVVRGSEVERVRRFQLELSHLLLHDPTAATM